MRTRRIARLAGLVLAAMAARVASAQAPAGLSSNLRTAGTPLAPVDPQATTATVPNTPADPNATPGQPPPVFAPRAAPVCADFKRVDTGGWAVTAPIELATPHGPVKLVAGQAFAAGDYVGGLDLGAVLERDCPRP